MKALDQIPELQRKALYLSYYEGYSQSEIAEMLGKSESTVGVMLYRLRRRLKKIGKGEL